MNYWNFRILIELFALCIHLVGSSVLREHFDNLLLVINYFSNLVQQCYALLLIYQLRFQCFDAVGWATGRASCL